MDEEVSSLSLSVRAAVGVVEAGEDQHLELFVRLDEGIDKAEGAFGWDVGVEFTDHEKQFAFEFSSVGDVGLLGIPRPHWIAHPLFVPPDLVHAVVVATCAGDGNLVELRVK